MIQPARTGPTENGQREVSASRRMMQVTEREMEILALVAEGLTNAQIARRLRVSDNTVKFHLQNVYLKLGVRNRTEAAAHYLRQRAARQRGL